MRRRRGGGGSSKRRPIKDLKNKDLEAAGVGLPESLEFSNDLGKPKRSIGEIRENAGVQVQNGTVNHALLSRFSAKGDLPNQRPIAGQVDLSIQ